MKYIKEYNGYVRIMREDFKNPVKIKCVDHFHIAELKGSYECNAFQIIN